MESSHLLRDLLDAGNKHSPPTGTCILHSHLAGHGESKERRNVKSFLKLSKSSQRIMQLVFQCVKEVGGRNFCLSSLEREQS